MKNKKVAIIISPNWRKYARKYLDDCLAGIKDQIFDGEMKIFMTDNETSEESFEFLKKKLPENAKIHRNKNNDGFAKGCNDAMKMALEEDFDYLINFNIDAQIDKNCVAEMVKTAESDEKIGAVQARLMMFDDRETINSLGNFTHFLGFGFSSANREKISDWEDIYKKQPPKDIHYSSGTAVLFRRKALEEVGLFDEEYWMYNEDQELPWRMWLAGWRSVLAYEAVVYNKYEFKHSKMYWMDRNRIISVLICYRLATILLIIPPFLMMELGHIAFSLKSGWFSDKMKVWFYFLKPRTWKYIYKARKRDQNLRKVKDKQIAKLIVGKIWYQEVNDWKLRIINPIFDFYWKSVKKIIFW